MIAIIVIACKQSYTPPAITANANYLVVEGLININDSTFINLSRTVRVMSASTVKPELKATVTIESNTGNSYPLKEVGNGVYSAQSYNLSPANQYRPRIRTSNANTYTSDFGPTKVTPPIDSMIRQFKPDGLYISVNTHDATGNTRYYRWEYSETWVYTAAYDPSFIVVNNHILLRTPVQSTYTCWRNVNSSDITLASSAKLTQDVMYQAPITLVPMVSAKLSSRYSILVKQYALTEDAFNFWQLLKKNTEQLGGIFDAQPSSITGNIHNIADYSELVLGYISAGSAQQKRIFVDNKALPKGWGTDSPFNICAPNPDNPYNPVTVPMSGYAAYFFGTVPGPLFLYTPISIYQVHPGPDTLFDAVPVYCADCRMAGGSINKPAFWQ